MLVLYFTVFGVKKWLQTAVLIFYLTQVSFYSAAFGEIGCHLPQHPVFGEWYVYNTSLEWYPGTVVPSGTILRVRCEDGYVLKGSELVACIDEKWFDTIGLCLKTCPPLHNTTLMTVTCLNDRKEKVDCTRAPEDTRAQFKCARYYETQELETRLPTICIGGEWSNKVPECVPVCGRIKGGEPTLIINGTQVTEGHYPWQVAIYMYREAKSIESYQIPRKELELICGGTLLNTRVVLTAAHCVSHENGTVLPKSEFRIAAGKYYRKIDDPRDFGKAQIFPVLEIFISQYYEGETQNYYGDIAIVATEKNFILADRVQPICVDWNSLYYDKFLDPIRGQYGYVAGWGYTVETGIPSDVLQELEVPLINYQSCKKQLPEDFRQYMTSDKLCAGFLNKSTSVCKGDSGGGLVFEHNKRYYIAGIVSLGPRSLLKTGDNCNSQQYSLYTSVSHYISGFISKKMLKIREYDRAFKNKTNKPDAEQTSTERNPSSSSRETIKPDAESTSTKKIPLSGNGCILPEHPEFGKWKPSDLLKSELLPGQFVNSGTHLRMECQEGHLLNGSGSVVCDDGSWSAEMGRCLKTCPPLLSTPRMTVNCISDDWSIPVNCSNAVDGTLASSMCEPYYEDLALSRNRMYVCVDGRWDQNIPACSPVCGQVPDDDTDDALFPWHVAIYTKTNKELICSGSLINERFIVTAAHCVTDSMGNLKSKKDFIVTVGNHYRRFNDSQDKDSVQISALHEMFILEQYKASKEQKKYFADIAALVTENNFILTERVQPVCLNTPGFGHNLNKYGYVMGWGYNIDKGKPPDVLTKIKIPSSSIRNCTSEIPPIGYESYITFDKICASFMGNSTLTCFGDTGAGLVYKHEGRYYLGGIMGLSDSTPTRIGSCARQQYASYSKAYFYTYMFILKKEALFRPLS